MTFHEVGMDISWNCTTCTAKSPLCGLFAGLPMLNHLYVPWDWGLEFQLADALWVAEAQKNCHLVIQTTF